MPGFVEKLLRHGRRIFVRMFRGRGPVTAGHVEQVPKGYVTPAAMRSALGNVIRDLLFPRTGKTPFEPHQPEAAEQGLCDRIRRQHDFVAERILAGARRTPAAVVDAVKDHAPRRHLRRRHLRGMAELCWSGSRVIDCQLRKRTTRQATTDFRPARVDHTAGIRRRDIQQFGLQEAPEIGLEVGASLTADLIRHVRDAPSRREDERQHAVVQAVGIHLHQAER